MRPTLALLLDNLFDSYEELLFAAVRDAAAARDVNLFVFVGGAFVPRAGGKGYLGKNLVYDLLPGARPDALVLFTGPLGIFVDDAELRERVAALPAVPGVGVGRATPGLPSLVLDNAVGMSDVVHHLALSHGCRRIAFVGAFGPEGDARRQGYRQALAQCRLPHDPALEVPGDFSREAGTRAVEVLLDERRVSFDALVCANDMMAIYALRELLARGIRVPEQVRVAGFDDVAEAAGADPPLATLAQPLREMGAAAVDLALRRLAGEEIPAITPLRGRLVPRRSCGCLHGAAEVPDVATLEELVEAQAAARTRAAEEFKGLQRVLFPTDVSEEEVREVLLRQLPNLGVRGFYLSRFVDPGHTRARLVAHFGAGDRVLLDREPGVFDARRLVPGRLSPGHRHAFAVLPIYAREERLGFALMDLVAGPGATLSGSAYEALMNQVSTAVRVSTLLAEVRGHADELERKVEERTRELAGAQRQLLETARQAGMAEIAVGALHNIGNLLTSVNVSAAEVAARAGTSEVNGVRRVAALLEEHRGDLAAFFARDARAALLPEYLSRLAARLGAEQAAVLEEASGLQHQLKLIRETIVALQSYAREGDELFPRERIDLGEVLDAAVRLQEGTLLRHGVRVHRELPPLPGLLAQRSRVLHVVVNVVKNAAEAMRAAPEGRRQLTVTGRVEDGAVLLAFQDQGEGIAAEDLGRVFTFGFTTKAGGTGMGLHTCANMMRQLGGDIRVESDGAGRGARVTLRFPVDDGAAAAAQRTAGSR